MNVANVTAVPATGDGPPRNIVATEYAEFDPDLSPDGRWLAYASNRTGRTEIWVQRYRDGVAVRVSSNGGFEPRWSADGRELYYFQGDAVMGVAVQAGDDFSFSAPEQLFGGPYSMLQGPIVSSFDVASDGRFLMLEAPGGPGANAPATGIVVVQNWTEGLKRRVPSR
jgi:serine/threonine-protein kinase